MNRINNNMLLFGKYPVSFFVAIALSLTVMPGLNSSARASDAGAFVGGMVAGHVVSGFVQRDRMRTAAEVEQANAAQAQAAAPAPAPAPAPQQQTAEQKMQELDKLAAGGYITPEEYKAKKKAIMDSM
jgi:hypothetical protein